MSSEFEFFTKKTTDGEVCGVTVASPAKETENEDSLLIEKMSDQGFLIAVSDGMGGHKGGSFASKTVVDAIRSLHKKGDDKELIGSLVHSLEAAHRKIKKKGIGAGATFVGALIRKNTVRFISVGDSKGLHVGGLGALKYQTIEHSPVGFAVESGLIEEAQDVFAEESHLISNVLGHGDVRLEMSQALKISKKDTVLLASDGLLANLNVEEVAQFFRAGALQESLAKLAETTIAKMKEESGHPDDLTIVAFERGRK